jgi:hypothetical protein
VPANCVKETKNGLRKETREVLIVQTCIKSGKEGQ